jgi:hypothetical protein
VPDVLSSFFAAFDGDGNGGRATSEGGSVSTLRQAVVDHKRIRSRPQLTTYCSSYFC